MRDKFHTVKEKNNSEWMSIMFGHMYNTVNCRRAQNCREGPYSVSQKKKQKSLRNAPLFSHHEKSGASLSVTLFVEMGIHRPETPAAPDSVLHSDH